MGAAYFIRGGGESWAVIKLLADNREEVVQDGMTLIEAEILCVALIEDLPRGAAAVDEQPVAEDIAQRRRPRQLKLKF